MPAVESLDGLPDEQRVEARGLWHELALAPAALEEDCAPDLDGTIRRSRDYRASLTLSPHPSGADTEAMT
jgi:hypothetical protein